jgi:hypothetical protein
MPGSRTAARIVFALSAALLAAGTASSADLDPLPDGPRGLVDLSRGLDVGLVMPRICTEDVVDIRVYPPAPRYVYDNRRGPTWTGNGWAYLPIGEHPPDENAPALVAPPPPHGFHPGEIVMIPCRLLRVLPDYLPFEFGPR